MAQLESRVSENTLLTPSLSYAGGRFNMVRESLIWVGYKTHFIRGGIVRDYVYLLDLANLNCQCLYIRCCWDSCACTCTI